MARKSTSPNISPKKKDDRTKNWAAIFYPESLPEDWLSKCRALLIDILISPLHDQDILPDGQKKKPHYHVIFKFSSNKSFEQVKSITDQFNAPIPQKVDSMKGAVRYFIHADDPDKAPYKRSDIQIIGNVDIDQYFQITQSDRYAMVKEMIEFVRDNEITEFFILMDYATEHRFEDWLPLLCDSSAYIIDKYITSLRNKLKDEEQRRVMQLDKRGRI